MRRIYIDTHRRSIFKSEGRRQKEYCFLPSATTGGSKGLRPPPQSLIWWPQLRRGLNRLNPLLNCPFCPLPPAFCLLQAAITAAIAAFSGSLHGGATERALELIDAVGTPDNAEAYVRNCLERNQPVMGFGHRVYRTEDPRVRHFREAACSLSWERRDTHGLAIIEAIVKAMEPYSLHGVEPNADLYAGLTYRLLGLPDDLAVPMYVAGRIAGWIAQSLEQKSNNVLIRPRLQYVGATSRNYRLL
ncbi:MAG: citrate/2-methylcitrate synthase [Nostoc sp.]|uniref:citrate/2-methylcitrate synthase n=1 Tax=Nostoc sp. TaxID=1180 RepID=UPI002FFA09AF